MSGRRILLVSYFYPPCRDTGAHRPASLAKYLRRAGHDVTVLTTSAYGSGSSDEDAGVERTALALDLVGDRPLHGPERVHVLDLDPGPERFRAA